VRKMRISFGGSALSTSTTKGPREEKPKWLQLLKQFEVPKTGKAVGQILNTVLPYFAMLVIMYLTIYFSLPYWVTLLLSIPTAGFLIRIFIFFHDCCHGSFFKSKRAMKIFGNIFGVLTFTPFSDWRYAHGQHHQTAGNLDHRGMGDVWTMTVDEYRASSKAKQFGYRLYRNPLVMFGLGPIYNFLILHRFPQKGMSKKTGRNVLLSNLSILAVVIIASLTIGFFTYLKIQLPVIYFAGMGGIWLFYVQHQFDPTYWARDEEWGTIKAAMEGSSFYKLPAVLNWFSGNIGLHHIHHLKPRIPNYNLMACLKKIPELQQIKPLTLWRSFKSVNLHLWDEAGKRLLSFRAYAKMLKNGALGSNS
jgi:omega-6 fatty acid desaturase (delta-12 desaturase)